MANGQMTIGTPEEAQAARRATEDQVFKTFGVPPEQVAEFRARQNASGAAPAGETDQQLAANTPPKKEEIISGTVKITPSAAERTLEAAKAREAKAKEEVAKAEEAKKAEELKQLKAKQLTEAQAAMRAATATMTKLQDALAKNPNDPALKAQMQAAQTQLDAAKKTLGDLGSDGAGGGIGQTLGGILDNIKGGNLASGAVFAFLGYILAGIFGEGMMGSFASIALPIAMFFMGSQNGMMSDFFSSLFTGGKKTTAQAQGQGQAVSHSGPAQGQDRQVGDNGQAPIASISSAELEAIRASTAVQGYNPHYMQLVQKPGQKLEIMPVLAGVDVNSPQLQGSLLSIDKISEELRNASVTGGSSQLSLYQTANGGVTSRIEPIGVASHAR